MILGIGSDIIDIRRIERTLERFGERFIARVFTDIERRKSDRRAARAASYAKRFAAKEACAKALGTGFRKSVYWRDIGRGQPALRAPDHGAHGGAREHLRRMVPAGHEPIIHLTITDEYPLCTGVRHHIGGAERP